MSNLDKNIKNNTKRTLTTDSELRRTNTKQKGVIFKISDALVANNYSLMDTIHTKITDRVIDGKEYQLIRRSSFIN